MKKFNEYSSFEDKILATLKKGPCDLMSLSHKLKEDIMPVSSMLEHLKVYDKVEMYKEKWQIKRTKKSQLEKMSYSRWITSTFYTYWSVSDAKNKNDELFMCHTDIYKSYKFKYIVCKRIVEDLTSIKGKINEIEGDEDAIELQGYIKEFIEHVDEEYGDGS